MKFVEFIRYLRQGMSQPLFEYKGIVLGNSSGDLDSVISTLGFSYFSYKRDSRNIILPVISFADEDLQLKRDIVYALEKIGLGGKDLIFANEMEQAHVEKKEVYLVDHNRIDNEWVRLLVAEKQCVVAGIIDHHVDNQDYCKGKLSPYLIAVCGSCSSLVFQWFDGTRILGSSNEDPGVQQFLCQAILADTSGLQRRVGAEDRCVIRDVYGSNESLVRSQSDNIHAARVNVDGLSTYDLLRKDYKQYQACALGSIGISSLSVSVENTPLEDIHQSALRWMGKCSLNCLLIMTSFTHQGEFRRELLVCWENPAFDTGISSLIHNLTTQLQLEETAVYGDRLAAFNQLKVDSSRKQVAPLVLELAQSL